MFIRTIVIGTLVAGSLDIASAILLTLIDGRSVVRMLQAVASGPFGDAPFSWGTAGAATGLAIHFLIMAAMVAAFVQGTRRVPALLSCPFAAGAAYGLLLYLFMYWLVIPLRWPTERSILDVRSVLIPAGIHITLVGIPIALVTTRMLPLRAPRAA